MHGVEAALACWAVFKAEQGFGPRQKKKKENPFRFSNPFYNFKPI
jgi:hypothetical protein